MSDRVDKGDGWPTIIDEGPASCSEADRGGATGEDPGNGPCVDIEIGGMTTLDGRCSFPILIDCEAGSGPACEKVKISE